MLLFILSSLTVVFLDYIDNNLFVSFHTAMGQYIDIFL